jgi:predicted HTH domain antitoxin
MQITISVPERPFVAEPRDTVSAKIRLHAAAGMYRVGELSIGAACELAGVDRYTFLDFCRRQGIALQTQTPDELDADFARFTGE